jgi:DNA-binding GntR family transcriptional regulator
MRGEALSPLSQSPDHTSIHASPYEWLRKMTVDCCFRPGEQLIIGELAERLRVSPTPVREALIRLQTEALLDTVPRRGFFARTLRSKEMISVLQLKYAILKFSIEQAIHPLDSAATMVCSPTLAAGNENDIALTTRAIDKNFLDQRRESLRYVVPVWGRIAALSGNEAIMCALNNADDRTHYVRMIDLEDAGRSLEVQRMIEELSVALHRNDAAAAIAVMKTDLDESIRRMPQLVNEAISRAYAGSSSLSATLRLNAWSNEAT